MSLHLLHAALAAGTLLVAVPIAIHLFNRRKAIKVPFAAIRFVELSNRATARSLQIRRLLLLLMRCLMALLIPLAAARPFLAPDDFNPDAAQVPGATVIVFDDSLSMRLSVDDRSLFERGRAAAMEAVRRLDGREKAALLFAVGDGGDGAARLDYDRRPLLDALRDAEPKARGADLGAALERAARLLGEHKEPHRRVVLVSDMARGGTNLERKPFAALPEPPTLRLVDAGEGIDAVRRANAGIVDVQAARDTVAGRDAYRVKVRVLNAGTERRTGVRLSLFAGGVGVADGFVDADPGETVEKSFTQRFDARGLLKLEARLEPDALPDDDVRRATIDVGETLRVLVVNGEPSTTPFRDEVFYLERALNPKRTGESRLSLRTTTPDATAGLDFAAFDAVILANVPRLPDRAAAALVAWVEKGGAVLIACGAQLDTAFYNAKLAALLPGDLMEPKNAKPETDAGAAGAALGLDRIDLNHPTLAGFEGDALKSLYAARFEWFTPIRPDPARRKDIVLRYTNDQPAVAAVRVGMGRVLVYTATVDRGWTDWPIRPSFPAFMQQAVQWLTGRAFDERDMAASPGDTVTVAVERRDGAVSLVGPDGARTPLTAADAAAADARSDKAVYTFKAPDAPGVYRMESERGRPRGLAVNADAGESDIRPVDETEWRALVAGGDPAARARAAVEQGGDRVQELWRLLMGAAVAAFVIETLVAASLSRPVTRRGATGPGGQVTPVGT